jgi:SulP family sulfate permease
MQETGAVRWDPREAIAPALSYLQQPLRLVREYDRSDLQPDILAGITVAVILLPQAIAFSLIAELPPQMGLYAAVIGGVIAGLWGSSRHLSTGPTNALSLLVLSALSAVAVPGSDSYILAAGLMAVMVGALQLSLGLLRLGVIVNFVSYSVIVGFATGAAVLIAVGQLGPLLGISAGGGNVLETIRNVITGLPDTQLVTAALGLGSMALILILQQLDRRLPGPLITMIVASVAVFLLGERAGGVAVIGQLPQSLPPIADLPLTNLELIAELSTGALAVAAIGLVQTIAIARTAAAQTGQRLDSNQEFVGQGLANVVTGVFSGYAVSGSFSRTAVNLRVGARTPMAAIFASAFVLIMMFVAAPLGAYLPVSALSGVLIITAFGMTDRAEIARIFRGAPGDAIIMVVTFLGTLFLNLEFAVLAGIILSFVLYIMRTSTPRVHVVLPDDSYRHFGYQPDKAQCVQLTIVEIMGDLYFGAVHHVEDAILDMAKENPGQIYLLIRMHHVNQIDFSGIHMLESVIHNYRERGGDVFFVRVNPRVRHLMETTGCADYIGPDNFLDEDTAISHIFYHVLDPAICIYECPVRAFKECQNLPKRLDLIDVPEDGAWAEIDVALVSPAELWQTLHSNGAPPTTVVDVREPREYRQSHIAEAISLPLSDILKHDYRLPQGQRLVLVCQSGRRSRRAAYALQQDGYTDLAILDGGMTAWTAAGLLEATDIWAAQTA